MYNVVHRHAHRKNTHAHTESKVNLKNLNIHRKLMYKISMSSRPTWVTQGDIVKQAYKQTIPQTLLTIKKKKLFLKNNKPSLKEERVFLQP